MEYKVSTYIIAENLKQMKKGNKDISEQIMIGLKSDYRSKAWLSRVLGCSQDTIQNRFKHHDWKASEILALQQLNILK